MILPFPRPTEIVHHNLILMEVSIAKILTYVSAMVLINMAVIISLIVTLKMIWRRKLYWKENWVGVILRT